MNWKDRLKADFVDYFGDFSGKMLLVAIIVGAIVALLIISSVMSMK